LLSKPQMLGLLYALKNQYKITDSEEIKFFLDLKENIDQRKRTIQKLVEEGKRRPRFFAAGNLKRLIEEGKYYHRDKLLIAQKGHVVGLNLRDWGLTEVPESIGNLKYLQTLDLSYNQFKTLPDSIERLISLKSLSLNDNFNLDTIPSSITTLAQKIFSQKYIRRGLAPKEALALALLEILSGRVMKKFPEGEKLGELDSIWHHYRVNKKGYLTEIYLLLDEFMHIVLFPKEICGLRNLEVLILLSQGLKFIPFCIKRLKKLKILDLSLNNIKSIPSSISEMSTLEEFKI